MKKISLIIGLFLTVTFYASAQCPAGQVQVTIDVGTDTYGYELYWQLVPSGNSCGVAPIFSGGNTSVGCNGGGLQNQLPGGYGNNTVITEGPWCLTKGANYDIIHIDDWADGGTSFIVNISGYPVYSFQALTSNEVYTFEATPPAAIDGSMKSISIPTYIFAGSTQVKGVVKNTGINNITTLDLNYSADNGATVTQTLTGLNIASFSEYNVVHPTPWIPTTPGSYSIEVWISNVNGQGADGDPGNDSQTKIITVKPPVPNLISNYLNADSMTFDIIGNSSDTVNMPRDLDFSPNGDLWLVNKDTEGSGGSTVKFTNPGEANQTSQWQRDGNAWHFMSLPTGIAFSDNGNFATSTGVYDANHNGGAPFTGPALWSSDPNVYAITPPGGNGSHLDMLHESPYCMGIAHEEANAFWVFDANSNDIVRYDFVDDHGPGNDDHSDGIVRRYPEVAVDWINADISSHLVLHKNSGWLYIVDGGNQRVLRLDINSGTKGGTPSFPQYDVPLAEYTNVTGVTWEVVVDSGLSQPSGIDVIEDRMVVTDHATGDIIFYDISTIPAVELGRIHTGSAGIMGIVIGPLGNLWYVNATSNQVVKITAAACITQDISLQAGWNMISSYVDPGTVDILTIVSKISSDVLIVKNGAGQAAIPSLGINSIGNWNKEEGYKMKLSNSNTLSIGCDLIDPSTTPITLSSGWNMISYLRNSNMAIGTALNSIISNVLIVKNASGATYIPSLGINTIGDMMPGQGYKVRMSSGTTLYYPANN